MAASAVTTAPAIHATVNEQQLLKSSQVEILFEY